MNDVFEKPKEWGDGQNLQVKDAGGLRERPFSEWNIINFFMTFRSQVNSDSLFLRFLSRT